MSGKKRQDGGGGETGKYAARKSRKECFKKEFKVSVDTQ